jgi:ketosteroid isomerase-like protein
MSTTDDSRRIIAAIFAELAAGNPKPFADALDDDVRWITPGHCAWSRMFHGKPAVLDELLGPVRAQLTARIQLTVRRLFADGDHVIVEASGQATTKTGRPYNNDYCFIYRLAGGKIVEVTEYMDTDLACSALTPPPPRSSDSAPAAGSP